MVQLLIDKQHPLETYWGYREYIHQACARLTKLDECKGIAYMEIYNTLLREAHKLVLARVEIPDEWKIALHDSGLCRFPDTYVSNLGL